MKKLDKKTVILNDGEKDVEVLVYLKEIKVRGSKTAVKAFCRMKH